MKLNRHLKHKTTGRIVRHRRVRAKLSVDKDRPRLAVFRSAKHIYAQLIDDCASKTLVAASDLKLTGSEVKGGKIKKAAAVGEAIAKLAMAKKIKQVRFDRGGYIYTGRVKTLAEAARSAGLEF